MAEIYFDNNATTRPFPEVRDVMLSALGDRFGNPSSVHAAGDRGREHLRVARENLATLLGGDSSQIVFTSGGTESNNMVFASAVSGVRRMPRIVTTQVEHSSVIKMGEYLAGLGFDVVLLPVNASGLADLDQLAAAITPDTALVSVQWVNNETGVIHPIREISEICRDRGVHFHTDAAQAVGKLDIDLRDLKVDFLSLTAHKLHGPQGVGALFVRDVGWLKPMLFGGPQERDLRAGTENVPGICGFGKAVELRNRSFKDIQQQLRKIRNRFESGVLAFVEDVSVNGDTENRACNTSNLRFANVDGQALVARLDQHGIRCSQSSACTNQRPEPSYVLRAMGLTEEEAYSSVRFSFGVDNTEEEVDTAVELIREICVQLRGFSARIHNPYQVART